MKKSILTVIILSLLSGSAFASQNKSAISNAQDYQPGAMNNKDRLADIDPNYELTMPSEKPGYTQYDNPYMSEKGTYSTYVKPNPNDEIHVADKGSLKVVHGQGGTIITEYTTKNGENSFTVMCGYTSGPAYWADSKPAQVCKDAQALAIALKAKGEWKVNPMAHSIPPAKITAESSL
ncbi:hypothetical protein CW745_15960 [Psychromonas sp. psych-6C06]|uniref:hypothetical protein n=1 Tax=Psychromonas sp. psych-6C06 TaxID=2058089 RepID=UPI000C348825|nr:hypothetical protein [Psychromonas sp. psych-6C06]PKF60255.1 hypothetical protein CW745_15960 [Psychromonas sp. psych-6C06]